MKNWMKCLVAMVAVICLGVSIGTAEARHGGREVSRSRTVVRSSPRVSRSVVRTNVRVDAGFSHHHNSFNSFRGFGDPGFRSYGYYSVPAYGFAAPYCPEDEFVEERTIIRSRSSFR